MKSTRFDYDVFISYAHLDETRVGCSGWVGRLHKALEEVLWRRLGKKPRIWRDTILKNDTDFENRILETINHTALLIVVMSRNFLPREWFQKEYMRFVEIAEKKGGIVIKDASRIFNVLMDPVTLSDLPGHLQNMTGYKFYLDDSNQEPTHPYDHHDREFWENIEKLVSDIIIQLDRIYGESPPNHFKRTAKGPRPLKSALCLKNSCKY